MKAFLAIAFLAALGLLVEAGAINHLKPKNIVVPPNPKYTYAEWQDIMAAQKQIPQAYPGFKRGSISQPASAGKVYAPGSRITNGNTAERGQFPWQVALSIDNAWFCGGSLISDQWVLTAAHCAGDSYEVILGANRMDVNEDGSQSVSSQTSIVHEDWDSDTLNNDICLVKVNGVQNSQYISAIKLPSASIGDLAGQTATVSGWGKTTDSSNSISNTLQFVDLKIITNEECAQTFGDGITPTKVCVATTDSKSPCNGDSGGPLVIRGDDGGYVEVGIVSFGTSAGCEAGYPAAFTRVSSYVDWIETKTGLRLI